MGHHEENLTFDARSGAKTLHIGRFLAAQLPQGLNRSKKHGKKRLKTGGFSPKAGNNSAKQDDFLPYIMGFHLKHEKSANI